MKRDLVSQPRSSYRPGIWVRRLKRPADLLTCLLILVLLSPVFVIVAIAVAVKLGRPILFSQERLGQRGARFRMYKFRSMTDARDDEGALLPDPVRLTPFGRLLRSTSLDELPQIVNVLRGEMSFVGPRATLPGYEPLIMERYPLRMEVVPGLTSLPAIHGRNALSLDEKFSYDVEYVVRGGFWMDLVIAALTIPVLLSRKGIEVPPGASAS
jgi:undecaprenyl phosphate N,N'-diacetylbacillosamine 1-phosphate transferase